MHAEQNVAFSSYRHCHAVEVSSDGGQNWTRVWQDYSNDWDSHIRADLSDYAGLPSVYVAFHYVGRYSSKWRIDNVVIDDQFMHVLDKAIRPETGVTYYLLEPSSWLEAQQAAEDLGGHLAIPDNVEENDWIYERFRPEWPARWDLWIGLTDARTEDTFEWVDGVDRTWDGKWAQGEPDNKTGGGAYPPGEDYVVIRGQTAMQFNHWEDVPNDPWAVSSAYEYRTFYGVVEMDDPYIARLEASPFYAGSYATIALSDFQPGDHALLAWSLTGGGPTPSFLGPIFLTRPIETWVTPRTDASGSLTVYWYIRPRLLGETIWIQALDVEARELSNRIERLVQ